ncbi:urease accessory protein UreD, partial [Sphaerotilus montanus]|uniref:urease accessory protein UreD n=1 Tax=Sphaerotilus montanus TaxID=522889 RepID=UPI003FA25B3E
MVEGIVFGRTASGEEVESCRLVDRWRVRRGGRLVHADTFRVEGRAREIGLTMGGGSRGVLGDEPPAGMSRGETTRFIQLIREVTEGRTLLTVEHDMGVVFGLADRIAVLVYGEVIAFDTPEAVRANPRVQEAYLGSVLAQGH